jgi:uncharacterized HAD superfamily protein
MKLAIACDETLAELMGGVLEYQFSRYDRDVRKAHVTDYHKSLSTLTSPLGLLREFCSQPERVLRLHPVEGSQQEIAELRKNHELYVLVSRPDDLMTETRAWLREYYGDSFKSVLFTTGRYGNPVPQKKAQYCRELGIEMVVDHLVPHAAELATPQRPVLLLNKPWNQQQVPTGIIRCRNWEDAHNYIKARE